MIKIWRAIQYQRPATRVTGKLYRGVMAVEVVIKTSETGCRCDDIPC